MDAEKDEPNSGWGLYFHFMYLLHKRKKTTYILRQSAQPS